MTGFDSALQVSTISKYHAERDTLLKGMINFLFEFYLIILSKATRL